MNMDQVAGSGNDEFYTPLYAIKPLLKYITTGTTVWCPFDTEESLIVKALRQHGCTVVNTHLSTGGDFFTTNPPPICDYIVSNPPYSLKGKVFERLFSFGIPFAMIVGVVGLFESAHRFNLFAGNKFEMMCLDKRVSYFKSYTEDKTSSNPPYSSAWITSNILPQQIVFETIDKTTKKAKPVSKEIQNYWEEDKD